MPACSSSSIPAVAQRLSAPTALAPDQCCDLLGHLAQVADSRHRRDRRYPLVGVLGIAVCAVLAGARSLAAIGEWASDAPGQVLAALRIRHDPSVRDDVEPCSAAWCRPSRMPRPPVDAGALSLAGVVGGGRDLYLSWATGVATTAGWALSL